MPVAAALGAAADALAVERPAAAAEAIRCCASRTRAARPCSLSGAPEPADDGARRPAATGPPRAADLVRGPAELMPAVRRLLRDVVVVGTLEDAEDLVYARPELIAVTAEGDVLGAHFAHGGSAGAPSLLEVQASVDEAAAELAELAVRCAELAEAQRARQRAARSNCAALVEELGERRRAAEKEKSVRRPAARAARRAGRGARPARPSGPTTAAARAQEALETRHRGGRGTGRAAAGRARRRRSRRSPTPRYGTGSRPTGPTPARPRWRPGSRPVPTRSGSRRSPGGPTRSTGGRAPSARRGRAPSSGAPGCATRRPVAGAVAAGARTLLAHVEVSLVRAEQERAGAEAAKAEREQELTAARQPGRDLKAELDKLTDSVHRGEVLGAEKRLRIEQLETKALEELGVEPAGLVAEYGPDQLVPPSPPAEGEELPDDPEHPRNQPVPYVRAEQEKRLRAAERAYQQLGKVNPLALEEFAALEERHKFLSEQLEDLKKTRADLLQVVKEVDERVEQVFTEAYRDTAAGVRGRLLAALPGRRGPADPDRPRQHAHHRRRRRGAAAGQEGQAALAALGRRALADRRGAAGVDLQGQAQPVLRDGRGRGGARRHQPPAADPDHAGAPGGPRSSS